MVLVFEIFVNQMLQNACSCSITYKSDPETTQYFFLLLLLFNYVSYSDTLIQYKL